jgi:DNA-binding transcriptional LysR family regulator
MASIFPEPSLQAKAVEYLSARTTESAKVRLENLKISFRFIGCFSYFYQSTAQNIGRNTFKVKLIDLIHPSIYLIAMSLSSIQLDAFVAVAKAQSFSGGAKALHITQSALSQRIQNLESDLGSTLFIRESKGIRLTPLGEQMLRYCLMKDSLENEFLGQIQSQQSRSLAGLIKFGGFSTVVRSVLVPSMAALLSEHSDVQIELITREMRQLPTLLETGQADFILLNKPLNRHGVENIEVGFEEYVMVEPKNGIFRENVFLDHDSDDSTTADFFNIQDRPVKSWRRSYFDEIYAIIDGVIHGAGRAIIPLHLCKQIDGIKITKGYRAMKIPVFFCYYQQAYYTSLHKKVIQEVKSKVPKILR